MAAVMSTETSTEVQIWPIDRLVCYARNPRKNDAAVDRMYPSTGYLRISLIPGWHACSERLTIYKYKTIYKRMRKIRLPRGWEPPV
jgi:hypothetical protein